MKNFKFIYLILAAVGAMAFTACNESDWAPGEADTNLGVYFAGSTDVVVTANDTSATILVKRLNAISTEAVVAIVAEDESGLFTLPSEIYFASGEESANYAIEFDGSKLTPGKEYNIRLEIDPREASNYGLAEATFTLSIAEPWNDLGEGYYIDDFMRVLVDGVEAGYGAPVKFQQHAENSNRVRVVNPFSMNTIGTMWGGIPGFFVWPEDQGDTYMEFDITDPNNVLLSENPAYLGVQANFGDDGILPLYLYVMENEDGSYQAPITYNEGVISFPQNAIVLAYPYGGQLSGWPSNAEGMTKFVMPGVELTDYTLIPAYSGMFVSGNNSDAKAIIEFLVGYDVESFKFTVVPGVGVDVDVQAVATGIVDGSITENVMEGNAEQTAFEVGLDVGAYTIVAVAYAGGEVVGDVATAIFYFPGTDGGERPEAQAAFVVDSVAKLLEDESYEERYPAEYQVGILLNIPNPAEIIGMQFYTGNADEVEAAIAAGKIESYASLVDSYGSDVYSWILGIDEGNIRILSVQPGTNLCIIMALDTIYGQRQYYHFDYQMPAYSGGFAIGDYTITEGEFSNRFNVSPATSSSLLFVEFADLPDYQFYGEWDKEKATLTIDGTAYGLEDYGSIFNMGLVQNEDKSYKVLTCASDAEFTTPSPIIFSLTGNAVSGLTTYIKLFRAAEENNSLVYKEDYYNFTPASVIAPVAATASVAKTFSTEAVKSSVSSDVLFVECENEGITIRPFYGDFERQFVMTSEMSVVF